MHLIDQFNEYIQTSNLLPPGSKLVVGVSGGPDSVALLLLCQALASEMDWEITVAHVNYGLRGADSVADEEFVIGLARDLDLPCAIERCAEAPVTGIEAWAREVRYDFFEETRKQKKADFIVVGHTYDDQAETVMLNFVRGSGVQGAAGMLAQTGRITRPLLETRRKDLVSYLQHIKQPYCFDETNLDTNFLRNQIRHDLLPKLEEANPRTIEQLVRQGNLFREAHEALESVVDVLLRKADQGKGRFEFSWEKWTALPNGFKTGILRRLARRHITKQAPKNRQIQEALRVLELPKNGQKVILADGLTLWRSPGKVCVLSKQKSSQKTGQETRSKSNQ
ncbi:tRNA lysidine(34) synthetase TilS [Patescibacteria group bacterium]